MMSDKKILVVDDEEAIINLLTQAFSRAGYTVLSAPNAADALKMLENEEIKVMFFDLNMPEMNGVELCREVKKNIPMSLIYAVTGNASLFELADCREAGFEDYFKKPVNIKTLIKTADDSFEKLERWKKV
ncbi:MAG: response regulator [Desulfobacteraceae bacterium]|nr:response regulator [Desulfobacteraceae bacterium]